MVVASPVPDLLTGSGSVGLAGRAVLVAVLLAVAAAGWWVARRRAGTFRDAASSALPGHRRGTVPGLSAADLGAAVGSVATFVQFSSATCATCPHVRRVLEGVAAARTGVVHVEVDAEARMDLVRRFGVVRTPTVLLLDPEGRLASRTSGPMTATQASAALDHLPHGATRRTDA